MKLLWTLLILSVISSPVFAHRHQSSDYQSQVTRSCKLGMNPTNDGSVQLSCPSYFQTKSNSCGAAAVMTLMRFYGKLSSKDMNQTTEIRILSEMHASDDGTTQSDVADWLSSHGFAVDSGARVSSDIIIDNLRKNIPTLVGVNHHWIVARGYTKGSTPAEDEIEFSDSCCGTTVISKENVDNMWISTQMPGNHCYGSVGQYIVATPK